MEAIVDAVLELLAEDWVHVLGAAGLYVAGAAVVRWRLIAEPYRNYIRARRTSLRAQIQNLEAEEEQRNAITVLLESVDEQLGNREVLLWGRGRERAASWQLMTAERLAARLLPNEEAVAHALTVLHGLGRLPEGSRPKELIDALSKRLEVVQAECWDELDQPQLRALSDQGLALLQAESNGRAADHLAFHRKAFWSMLTAFFVTVAVAASLGQPSFLLAGALGAAVSRLFLLIRSREVPRDYATLWTTLLLSPFVGALAAYGGVLLVATLRELELLGNAAAAFAWPQPGSAPAAPVLGLAFLFGFSERLLDRLARRAERGLAPPAAPKPKSPPPTADGASPSPGGTTPPLATVKPSGDSGPAAANAPPTQEGE